MDERTKERDLRQWLRHLHGESTADEARGIERRLAADGELAERYRRFEEVWKGLEGPPAAAMPADFSAQVVAAARDRLRQDRDPGSLSWTLAPAWARAGSVAALLAGLALGISIAGGPTPRALDSADPELSVLSQPLSLAESYWLALDESDGGLGNGDAAGGEAVR